jgi:hypothetical protein
MMSVKSRKTRPTRRRKPLIDHTFTDPAIRDAIAAEGIREIRRSQEATRAILEAGLHMPETKPGEIHWIEDRLQTPEPMPRPLLPNRWWENASSPAREPQRYPILTVSPQLAEVLNIGIDRVIDIATQREKDLLFEQGRVNSYMNHYDRILQFLENAHDRLAIASPAEAVIEAIVAVRSAMQTIVEEPRP